MVAYENYTDVAVGWPSLIPPILAMVLALSTKEVVSSLFVGVFSAAVIYSIAVAKGMVENLASANVLDVIFTVMGIKISNNVHICLFILFIGALIHLVSVSGGSKAYGVWAKKAIKGRRRSMFSTMALGAMMFLDDYFNSITTSTVMKTVTEVNNVSRPKTAYIVHTMSTNMCITIPLTSWAAAIVSQIEDSGVENSFVVFLSAIPFNIYSLLCFLLVLILITFDFDYGKMKFYEDNAKLGLTETNEDVPEATEEMTMKVSDKGTMWDLLLPIFVMVVLAVFFMFYLGGMWSGEKKSITQVLGDTSAPKALLYACFVALITTLVMYVPRKLMTFAEWINYFIEGMKTMISTLIILVLAWCVSGTSGDLLQTGTYIGTLVKNSPIPPQLIPAVVFFVGMGLSFATGTAWGTFSLLIPIAVSICSGENAKYLVPSIASCLCGAVFGNNTSPISDTTVLVSSTIQCSFLVHVSTQLPYAATVAFVSLIGFIVAGYTGGNLAITWIVSLVLMAVTLGCIYMYQKNHELKTKSINVEDDTKKKNDMDVEMVEMDGKMMDVDRKKGLGNEEDGMDATVTIPQGDHDVL